MKVPFLELQMQYASIKEEIDTAIQKVLDDSLFIGGERVKNFENEFAQYLGVQHCVSCGNGSDALEIALQSLNIGKGDEVIVPALTWIATANAVKNVGAKPIFVDILPNEMTLNPDLISEKISSQTKAIIPVHLYGLPARMPQIMDIASQMKLWVIEDCAQSHGAKINCKKTGTFGHLATFSFYPTKTLGAYGDGGAIVTNDSKIEEKIRTICNHGQLKKNEFIADGRNSKLDTLQAAILSVKLRYLDTWIEKKRILAKQYIKNLKSVKWQLENKEYYHAYHLFVIQTKNRERFIKKFEENSIGYGIHYPQPLPCLAVFGNKHSHFFPIASTISKEIVSLPLYPELTTDQQKFVVQTIKEITS